MYIVLKKTSCREWFFSTQDTEIFVLSEKLDYIIRKINQFVIKTLDIDKIEEDCFSYEIYINHKDNLTCEFNYNYTGEDYDDTRYEFEIIKYKGE